MDAIELKFVEALESSIDDLRREAGLAVVQGPGRGAPLSLSRGERSLLRRTAKALGYPTAESLVRSAVLAEARRVLQTELRDTPIEEGIHA
jgi:hypothetical protein